MRTNRDYKFMVLLLLVMFIVCVALQIHEDQLLHRGYYVKTSNGVVVPGQVVGIYTANGELVCETAPERKK